LDLARWRVGAGIALALETVDLGELLQRVAAEHQAHPGERRVSLSLSGNLRGTWDPRRLEQAVSNLLGNALQHGSDGEPVVLEADGAAEGDVVLRVSNGGAVPESVRPRLFDPFRARERNGPSGSENGLGLGLYIVQQVVLSHGGRITLEAGDAERTTFRLELPRRARTGQNGT